jgi:hypothetical protein
MLPTISLRVERWKFNKDYGVYVSTLGHFKDRYKRSLPIKIGQGGYCLIKTEAPGFPWKLAHRLVMLTWKPIPDAENLTVDHLDHNKRDNSIYNLEWVTKEENERRAKKDQAPKKASAYSTTIPLQQYQLNIAGYEVNGVVYETANDIWKDYKDFFEGVSYREQEIFTAIERIRERKNSSGVKRIGNKKRNIVIKVVFKNGSN